MLPKKPDKRKDGRSSFSNLIDYICRKDIAHADDILTLNDNEFSVSDTYKKILIPNELLAEYTRLINEESIAVQHNCLTLENAAAEMKATAFSNAKCVDPVYHCILNWQPGEQPTDDQIFDSAVHVLNKLGMKNHQYVAAVHRDTDHVHVHIAVNRVHPVSGKAWHESFDFIKMSEACRELELKYGFMPSPGAHEINELGEIVRTNLKDKESKKPTKAADLEAHTVEESFFTYLSGAPKNAFLAALKDSNLDWQKLHQVMAEYNVEIRQKGSGLALYSLIDDNTTPIKASSFHQQLSFGKISKRLGDYIAPANITVDVKDAYRKPKLDPDERERRRLKRAELRAELYSKYKNYRLEQPIYLKEDPRIVKNKFKEIISDSRRLRVEAKLEPNIAMRKAMYSIISYQAVIKRDELKKNLKVEREKKKNLAVQTLSFQRWVEQQAAAGDHAAISQLRGWRYKEKKVSREQAGVAHDAPKTGILKNVKDIQWGVCRDGSVSYKLNNKVCFTDYGKQIQIADELMFDRGSIVAMLELAKRKGESFTITGTSEFQMFVRQVVDDLKNPYASTLENIKQNLEKANQSISEMDRIMSDPNFSEHVVENLEGIRPELLKQGAKDSMLLAQALHFVAKWDDKANSWLQTQDIKGKVHEEFRTLINERNRIQQPVDIERAYSDALAKYRAKFFVALSRKNPDTYDKYQHYQQLLDEQQGKENTDPIWQPSSEHKPKP